MPVTFQNKKKIDYTQLRASTMSAIPVTAAPTQVLGIPTEEALVEEHVEVQQQPVVEQKEQETEFSEPQEL